MANLTIKQLSPKVLERLREQARKKGQSLNSYIKERLAECAGLKTRGAKHTELSHLAGIWSAAEEKQLLKSIEPLSKVDEEMWR
jgi:hypothetical protein